MTLGQLRRLTNHLPDDTLIVARERDLINLEMLHIVSKLPLPKDVRSKSIFYSDGSHKIFKESDLGTLTTYDEDIKVFRGSDRMKEWEMNHNGNYIIFCCHL